MGDLSEHFSRWEFDCHDGSLGHPDPELVKKLELVRRLAGGRPLRIVSGYRSPAWNRKVGGAPNSQHLVNRAADLERGAVTVDQARAAGFSGIGFNGSWAVHVDVRPGRHVIFHDA